jgi:hypothetical protein
MQCTLSSIQGAELTHCDLYQDHGGHFYHQVHMIPSSYSHHVLLTVSVTFPGILPFSFWKIHSHLAFLARWSMNNISSRIA